MKFTFTQKFEHRRLRFRVLVPGLVAGILWVSVIADDNASKKKTATSAAPVYPIERYESLWKRSLFKKNGVTASTHSNSNWNLAGIYEISGVKSAVIISQSGAVETISTNAPNAAGIQLVTVQPGGKGAPPRVEISQNGNTEWVTARKIETTSPSLIPANRALVNSRAGTPVPRPPSKENPSDSGRGNQANANPAPPSPLDVPVKDVPLPLDPSAK